MNLANMLEQHAVELRKQADRCDQLAFAAEQEGDTWDAAELRGKAIVLRRKARRLEATTHDD